ncbi:MAG: hypothetical protein GYA50_02995 [Eubacteriaceae bacterium]|nr:hypothetical protein [Eubacteriaceae bacterium]
MKSSDSISDNINIEDTDEYASRIKSKIDKMLGYDSVPVDGREITRMRRIDREYKLYEEKLKNQIK